MPVVIVIYLLVVGVIVLGFIRWVRSRELHTVAAQEGGEPFAALPVSLAFDPEYAIIWDTQLPALTLISTSGANGVAMNRLCSCFIKDARRYPELYDGSSFRQWLQFLEAADLIESTDTRVVLTPGGREFLHFCLSPESVALPTRGSEQ